MDGLDGWMCGWVDGWIDGWIYIFLTRPIRVLQNPIFVENLVEKSALVKKE
jgi:hypothetical protein